VEQEGNVEKPIEVLMGEHRLIEQALGSLETYADEVRAGMPPACEAVRDYATFFRDFADTCHHGKEEDILFQRMIERGFSREAGPIGVMYAEHELGRSHVREMLALASGAGELSPGHAGSLLRSVAGYLPLLRLHILKEDQILYPLALRVLSGPELDTMAAEFESFERRFRADGSLDRLRRLADRLSGRFPPDATRMAEASRLTACGR
jgi:hemerythrin-like domain-containing protein